MNPEKRGLDQKEIEVDGAIGFDCYCVEQLKDEPESLNTELTREFKLTAQCDLFLLSNSSWTNPWTQ